MMSNDDINNYIHNGPLLTPQFLWVFFDFMIFEIEIFIPQ